MKSHLESVEAAPRLAVHAHVAVRPGLNRKPFCKNNNVVVLFISHAVPPQPHLSTYDLARVVLLGGRVLVVQQALRVAGPAQVGPHHDEAVRGHPRVAQVIAVGGPLAFAVRQIFENAAKSTLE